jgi:hypothetical protein
MLGFSPRERDLHGLKTRVTFNPFSRATDDRDVQSPSDPAMISLTL